ncbi:MAG: Kelch repeat-containing protein, partial [Polyangiales bacterium]
MKRLQAIVWTCAVIAGCTAQSGSTSSTAIATKPTTTRPSAIAAAARSVPALATALRASTVTMAGQRLAHGAGGFLAVQLPARASQPVRLSRTNDFWIELTAIGDGDVAATIEAGAARFAEAQPGVDVMHLAHAIGSETAFEEVRVLNDARAPTASSWRVHAGAAVAEVREIVGVIEIVDHDGRAHVRSPRPWVVDAAGTRRDATWSVARVAGARSDWIVTASFDRRDLRAPVVLDPAWLSTGALSTGRFLSPVVTMPTGKSIVVSGSSGQIGGFDTWQSLPIGNGEVYDPATRTWTNTKPMTYPRSCFGAALLPSGKVIAAGGFNGTAYAGLAEIYDPATNAWTLSGQTTFNGCWSTMVTTGAGTVLHVGNNVAPMNAGETFSESTGLWTAASNSMVDNRSAPGTALLPNGTVLVVGGYGGSPLASTSIYDPTRNLFSPGPSMTTPRLNGVVAALSDGRVIAVGGQSSGSWGSYNLETNTAEIYDPKTNTWSPAPSLLNATDFTAGVTASGAGGITYVAGGNNGGVGSSAVTT